MSLIKKNRKERPKEKPAFLDIGRILKPHGLGGELKVEGFTDDRQAFKQYRDIYLDERKYVVEYIKDNNKYFIFKISGIDSIEAAQEIQGCFIAIDRRNIAPGTGGPLLADFIGLEVLKKSDGARLGIIEDYIDAGVSGIFRITGEKGTLLIPCDSENWEEPDFEGKTVFLSGEGEDLILYQ